MTYILIVMINQSSAGSVVYTIDDVKLFMLLFANDAVVFYQYPKTLQSILNDIENYCISCGLKLNTNKTKIMMFEAGWPTHYEFYIYNKRIEIVESFKVILYSYFILKKMNERINISTDINNERIKTKYIPSYIFTTMVKYLKS